MKSGKIFWKLVEVKCIAHEELCHWRLKVSKTFFYYIVIQYTIAPELLPFLCISHVKILIILNFR